MTRTGAQNLDEFVIGKPKTAADQIDRILRGMKLPEAKDLSRAEAVADEKLSTKPHIEDTEGMQERKPDREHPDTDPIIFSKTAQDFGYDPYGSMIYPNSLRLAMLMRQQEEPDLEMQMAGPQHLYHHQVEPRRTPLDPEEAAQEGRARGEGAGQALGALGGSAVGAGLGALAGAGLGRLAPGLRRVAPTLGAILGGGGGMAGGYHLAKRTGGFGLGSRMERSGRDVAQKRLTGLEKDLTQLRQLKGDTIPGTLLDEIMALRELQKSGSRTVSPEEANRLVQQAVEALKRPLAQQVHRVKQIPFRTKVAAAAERGVLRTYENWNQSKEGSGRGALIGAGITAPVMGGLAALNSKNKKPGDRARAALNSAVIGAGLGAFGGHTLTMSSPIEKLVRVTQKEMRLQRMLEPTPPGPLTNQLLDDAMATYRKRLRNKAVD